jgi:hypothetical protein
VSAVRSRVRLIDGRRSLRTSSRGCPRSGS